MLQIRFFICNLGFLVGGNLDLGGGGIGAALGSRKKKTVEVLLLWMRG
jgi:hypothetical protein